MDMVVIKKDIFRDMGHKFRDWKHSLKKPLKIKDDDTPETVRARMTQDLIKSYDPLDIYFLLDKWCSKANKVSHDEFNYYFMFNYLIRILYLKQLLFE
jgi:hypothetical protein